MKKIRFQDMKIMYKLTCAYILFIIIPLMCIGYFAYTQLKEREKNDIIKGEEVTLNRINENLKYKMGIIDSISENISSNARLIRFLKNDYNYSSYSIEEYKYFISPIFEYSKIIQKINTHSIRIYMVGDAIEESPSIFYHESRIIDQEWYKIFLTSEQRNMWIGPNTIDFLHGIASDKKKFVYSYMHKFYGEDGTYLGILVINIYQDELFSNMLNVAKENQELFVLNGDGHRIYPQNETMGTLNDREIDQLIHHNKNNFTKKGMLYTFKSIESLNAYVGIKVKLNQGIGRNTTLWLGIIFIAIVSLLAIFYLILSSIFRHMKKQTILMDYVVEHNFDSRIPVTRHDELGQISRSFNALIDKINNLIKDIVVKETAQKDAKLKALQYQINPHFIYNTIDIFGNRMEVDGNYEMADAITDFGKMMRYNMSDVSMFSTIGDEINLVNSYINIEKLKYENRLHIFFDCPQEQRKHNIIKFILQPIVENSVMHGYSDRVRVLRIYVNIRVNQQQLKIEIADDGQGIGEEQLAKLNQSLRVSVYDSHMLTRDHGIGLKNINERIKIFYGEAYFIKLYSRDGQGMKTIINIPVES